MIELPIISALKWHKYTTFCNMGILGISIFRSSLADDNISEHETEAMPENSVPVEVQDDENEQGDGVENQDNDEEQGGADVEDADVAGTAVEGTPAEGVVEKKWPGWPGENVFRLLVPVQKVGGIIGQKGEYIKKTCEETRARIKILDGPPGTQERTV